MNWKLFEGGPGAGKGSDSRFSSDPKKENFGGAGLRARRETGGQGRPPRRKMAAGELSITAAPDPAALLNHEKLNDTGVSPVRGRGGGPPPTLGRILPGSNYR